MYIMSAFGSELRTLLSILWHTPLMPDSEASPDAFECSVSDPEQPENSLLFQALFESTVIGKCLLMPDGKLYAANGAMCAYLGYDAEEMARQTILSITHPLDRGLMTIQLQHLADGSLDSFQIEKRFVHKDGSALWALVYVTALYDATGRYQGAVAEIQDISGQKAEEQALAAERERLKLAENLAQMGTFEIDLVTGRTTWSEEIFQVLGLSSETFDLPCEIGMLNIHEHDRERVHQALLTATAEAKDFRVEFRVRHSGGEFRHHLAHGRVVLNRHAQPVKIMGYLLNVMPFKRRELQLQQTNRQLAAQNQQLLRLANLVADELTGSLAGIQAIASYEADRGHTRGILPLLAETRQGLDALEATSERIRQTRRLEEERRRVDLEAVCGRVLQMLEAEIRQSQVSISVDFSVWKQLEFIPGYLENLFFNLLSYALDQCRRRYHKPRILIRSEFAADARLLLSVQLLYEGDRASSDGEDDRLELVKALLAASECRLSVSPVAAGGSCFQLWF